MFKKPLAEKYIQYNFFLQYYIMTYSFGLDRVEPCVTPPL